MTELDKQVGKRKRSAFIGGLIRDALEERRRWRMIEASFGSIEDGGHEWDEDPAAWVRTQRRADPRRVG